MDFRAQIEQAGFPEGVEVSVLGEPQGRVFRVTGPEGRGFELLLTDDAVRMYGEGPSVATVLKRLHDRVGEGLPPARSPGEYEREVFVGD
ncbi:hypothetical protein V3W47_12315 [Deinococcus sp. YIM 134068]|uniref:hypothetical protein n=1 Tax=Deinococcus lichenicola TaxID=3118910 RepID=UPI002F92541F